MPVINQQTVPDTYFTTTPAQILNVFNSHGGWFSVSAASVYVQLQFAKNDQQGEEDFTPEILLGVGAFATLPPACKGVRFRNATPGSPAIVTAQIATGDEPPLAISALGTSFVTGIAPTRTVILATGTYNVPANTVAILVECIGGGGGGGGVGATGAATVGGAGGGGGGAYSAVLISGPATSYSVAIGAGGTGGAPPSNGLVGGDTNFGSGICVAKGGSGSPNSNPVTPPNFGGAGAVGAGGLASASVGSVKADGGSGTWAWCATTGAVLGGQGGAAALGAGMTSPRASTGTGPTGNTPGGGGGGGVAGTSQAQQNGGGGGAGQIVITEFH